MHALEENEAIEKIHAVNSSGVHTLKIPAKSTTARFSLASYRDLASTVSYTVTAGYIFCSLLVWGKGAWICL